MDLARCLIQRINVGDSLTRSAAARPGQLAVVDGPRRWTYAQFNGWVNQIAHGLACRGYTRGDALGLASGNSAEFLAVYFACAKLGLVCVPVNLGWRPDEVADVPGHSGARGLAVETQLIPRSATPWSRWRRWPTWSCCPAPGPASARSARRSPACGWPSWARTAACCRPARG